MMTTTTATEPAAALRIGVIGHVEHITLGRIAALPRAGDIVHVEAPRVLAGGGGGIAFFQLARGPAVVGSLDPLAAQLPLPPLTRAPATR